MMWDDDDDTYIPTYIQRGPLGGQIQVDSGVFVCVCGMSGITYHLSLQLTLNSGGGKMPSDLYDKPLSTTLNLISSPVPLSHYLVSTPQ